MQVNQIRECLYNNPKDIIKLLELAGFYDISFFDYKNEIRCAYEKGSNPTSVVINCETLYAQAYSRGISGDLFHLLEIHNDWEFYQVIEFIKNVLNLKENNGFVSPYIFNGIYRKIKKYIDKDKQVFPDDVLKEFIPRPNKRFLDDNISIETQRKFKVGYDSKSNYITVPWFNHKGQLVGVTGRCNLVDRGNFPKWKALIRFSKGNFLFGMSQNKEGIKQEGYVIIGESEKFVMQLDSYGYHNGLALGCCNISNAQARLIKSLPISKVILALDEGIEAEHMLKQCDKLKGGIFSGLKEIYCIYDSKNLILPKGSKAAPTDYGKEKFELLLNKCCYRKK